MTKDELENIYFEWMYGMVCGEPYTGALSWRKLLHRLHDTEFTYLIPMDGNRADDGIDLRYRFGDRYSYDYPLIAAYLDDRPCSVLEMLVALSLRCEEHIMSDPDIGDRTGLWFWKMIVNLGLNFMSDARFDGDHVDRVLCRFLNREYSRNGEGGLFTIRRCQRDLRSVEIWYQMCWYLDQFISFSGKGEEKKWTGR